MNIEDVQTLQLADGEDKLKLIFSRQEALMRKYMPIEVKNGVQLHPDIPLDIHSACGQAKLKLFAWYCTEEIAEAIDAAGRAEDGIYSAHCHEELADALHFLVEFGLLAGIQPDMLVPEQYSIQDLMDLRSSDMLDCIFQSRPCHGGPVPRPTYHFSQYAMCFVEKLGMTCHTLKNKAWKQTQMLTDIPEFKSRYQEAFALFVDILKFVGIDSTQLYGLYFRKSEVNTWRINSQY